MTTAGPAAAAPLDISSAGRLPLGRLVSVELRKAHDTRAGRWLLISMALVTAAVMVIQLAVVLSEDLRVGYSDFMLSTSFSIAILLPVLGILLVSSEWGQRTAMVTFSLEPRRGRVIAAKLVVGLILAVVAVAVALALGGICNLLYGAMSGDEVTWDLSAVQTIKFFALQEIGMLTGFALAALLLNSAAAIVIYFVYSFVLPGLFQLATLIDWFADIRPWIDFNAAQTPLIEGDLDGEAWAHLVVSGLIWLVLPLAIGTWRMLRAEVK